MGLANRVVPAGRAREEAEALAQTIAAFPPRCVRSDRRSAWEGAGLPLPVALANEFALGIATHDSGESQEGARRFADGAGRHGRF
jgi:enoyl-CoA hydratase